MILFSRVRSGLRKGMALLLVAGGFALVGCNSEPGMKEGSISAKKGSVDLAHPEKLEGGAGAAAPKPVPKGVRSVKGDL